FKNIGHLTIRFEFFVYIMDDSFFLDFVQSCNGLTLLGVNQIAADAIHAVFRSMVEGTSKCRRFKCDLLTGTFSLFLFTIGIELRKGAFFSNRDDIEVFYTIINDKEYCSIFDGNIEISISDYQIQRWCELHCLLKLHESEESLETVKNGMKALRVYPISEEGGEEEEGEVEVEEIEEELGDEEWEEEGEVVEEEEEAEIDEEEEEGEEEEEEGWDGYYEI
ncbi:hypothetical protein PMAYCL1PPCAC_01192, partial [Pristionchus mayeri]